MVKLVLEFVKRVKYKLINTTEENARQTIYHLNKTLSGFMM